MLPQDAILLETEDMLLCSQNAAARCYLVGNWGYVTLFTKCCHKMLSCCWKLRKCYCVHKMLPQDALLLETEDMLLCSQNAAARCYLVGNWGYVTVFTTCCHKMVSRVRKIWPTCSQTFSLRYILIISSYPNFVYIFHSLHATCRTCLTVLCLITLTEFETTCYGLDGPGIESRWGRVLTHRPDWPWGPPSLLYNGHWVLPGGKAAAAWHWPPNPI
jgi:hypothetical protein